jgi:hypothetical protein
MKLLRRIATAVGVGSCALALTACGASSNIRYADNLGPGYVKVGHLYYQVQIARELNAFSDEDSGYLAGLTSQQQVLPVGQMWFAVFMQAYNYTSSTQTPASTYYITDALGDRFTPLANSAPNSFSYQPAPIPAGGQLPALTSLAYFGPTQGEVLLFKFPYSTYSSRPLILHIVNPANPGQQSRIELDV